MVAAWTAVRRGTSAGNLLGGVAGPRTGRGLDALLGVVFVLSSGLDRSSGRTVRRAHGVSAGRLHTQKTQRARIFLLSLKKIYIRVQIIYCF